MRTQRGRKGGWNIGWNIGVNFIYSTFRALCLHCIFARQAKAMIQIPCEGPASANSIVECMKLTPVIYLKDLFYKGDGPRAGSQAAIALKLNPFQGLWLPSGDPG